jgi:2,3-dihydroxybiphenyl 1,2-dioxygenase
MDILGIGYLIFESPNGKAWLEYGPEVLGLGLYEPEGNGDTVYLRMDDRRWRIAIQPGERDRLACIGWELTNRTAWLAAIEKLKTNNVTVTIGDTELELKRGVHGVARFTDPVGYNHELIYGQKYQPNSFTPGRNHHGFLAEELGVGHVVLTVPEIPPGFEQWLTDVLGFRWFGHGAGNPRPVGGFYRPKLNDRSHCIAYLLVPGHMGIHHVGIEVKELDDVGIAFDLYQERGLPVMMTMGRHTQDPVISFYGITPSGFGVEYLTGGAIETDREFHERNPEKLSVWGHKPGGAKPLPDTVAPVGQA